jgi:hypothetical protein
LPRGRDTYEKPHLLLFAKTTFLKQVYSIGSLAVTSEDKPVASCDV